MKKEISDRIKTGAAENGAFEAEFCFPASFSGFQGHFPDQPVLPGVCLVQAVQAAAEQAMNRPLKLVEILLAKFMNVVLPDETLHAVCTVDAKQVVRAKIACGAKRVAEIRLRVDYA